MNVMDDISIKFRALGGQRDLVLWIAKYGAVILVFLFFFLPVQQRLSSYAENERSLKSEIDNMKKISEGFLNSNEIEDLNQRHARFEEGLVDTTQAAKLIDVISDVAEKSHLNLIQIYSDSPILIKRSSGEDLELDGRKLNLLPVSFRVEADFKNLAGFFHDLSETSKAVYTVESIHIQKASAETETLQCDITISFIAI